MTKDWQAERKASGMIIAPQYTIPDILAYINANIPHLRILDALANLLARVQIISDVWIGFRARSSVLYRKSGGDVRRQIITYSRHEVGLGASKWQALASYAAIQAGVYVMFLWFRSMMGDSLYLECFAVSIVFSNLFNIPMLLRRGSRKGQSLVIARAPEIQTGPVGFFMVHPYLGPYFMQPSWIAAGIANTVLALSYLWMLYRAPAYRRD